MAKKNYDDLSKNIVRSIGGAENVISLIHCATRLRFNVKEKYSQYVHGHSVRNFRSHSCRNVWSRYAQRHFDSLHYSWLAYGRYGNL